MSVNHFLPRNAKQGSPWEDRRGLDGMTTHVELEFCFSEPQDFENLLHEMAEFANGADAEEFRAWVRSKVDALRERQAEEAHERRFG